MLVPEVASERTKYDFPTFAAPIKPAFKVEIAQLASLEIQVGELSRSLREVPCLCS